MISDSNKYYTRKIRLENAVKAIAKAILPFEVTFFTKFVGKRKNH